MADAGGVFRPDELGEKRAANPLDAGLGAGVAGVGGVEKNHKGQGCRCQKVTWPMVVSLVQWPPIRSSAAGVSKGNSAA
jgi:hypothetical protein